MSGELKMACTIPDGTLRTVTAGESFAGPHLKDASPATPESNHGR